LRRAEEVNALFNNPLPSRRESRAAGPDRLRRRPKPQRVEAEVAAVEEAVVAPKKPKLHRAARPVREVGAPPKPKLPPAPRRRHAEPDRVKRDVIPKMADLSDEKRKNVARAALAERNNLREKWRQRTGVGVDFDPTDRAHRRRMLDYVDGANADDRERLRREAEDFLALQDYGIFTGVDHLSPKRRRKVHDLGELEKGDAELGIDPAEFNDLLPKFVKPEDQGIFHGNGKPKVSSLTLHDFDAKRVREIDDAQIENLGQIALLRDNWDDKDGLYDAALDLGRLRRQHEISNSGAQMLLRDRDWAAQNPELVKDMQAQYLVSKFMLRQDDEAVTDFANRQ